MSKFFQYLSVWSVALSLASLFGRLAEPNVALSMILGGFTGFLAAMITIAIIQEIRVHCEKFSSWHWSVYRAEKDTWMHFLIFNLGHYCIYFESEDYYFSQD